MSKIGRYARRFVRFVKRHLPGRKLKMSRTSVIFPATPHGVARSKKSAGNRAWFRCLKCKTDQRATKKCKVCKGIKFKYLGEF